MSPTEELSSMLQKLLVGVKTSGSENLMAKCPFHRKGDGSMERTASFSVSLTKGVWFCFGCQEKGNLRQLFELLNEPVGSRLDAILQELRTTAAPKYNPTRPRLLEVFDEPLPEKVLGAFDECPVALVEDDGFSESTLQYFGVGYDRKNTRITFPLRDITGVLVGISGRTVIDQHPRYKVYDSEFAAYGLAARAQIRKSTILWNGDKVYQEACFRKLTSPIVIVEGFKACMRVWDAGYKNAVALLGTYLSEDQQWVLERVGAPVVLMLDRNSAGMKGMSEVGRKLSKSLQVRVVGEYFGEQPSDLCEVEVQEAITRAKSYARWAVEEYQTPERR